MNKITNEQVVKDIEEYKENKERFVLRDVVLDYVLEALENQKTGHWIEHGTMRTYHRYKCSVCGGKRTGETGDWIQIHECKYHYCPDCGAKMEGE